MKISQIPIALVVALMVMESRVELVNAAPAGYYQDQKVVYHNDGGTPDSGAYFLRMLNSIKNHIDVVGKDHLEIRVVNHGAGIDLFEMARTDKDYPSGSTRYAIRACVS